VAASALARGVAIPHSGSANSAPRPGRSRVAPPPRRVRHGQFLVRIRLRGAARRDGRDRVEPLRLPLVLKAAGERDREARAQFRRGVDEGTVVGPVEAAAVTEEPVEDPESGALVRDRAFAPLGVHDGVGMERLADAPWATGHEAIASRTAGMISPSRS